MVAQVTGLPLFSNTPLLVSLVIDFFRVVISGLIPMSCIIFVVEIFHVLGFSISSMAVIRLLLGVSSLHIMLIILCIMLCVMPLSPVSIYIFFFLCGCCHWHNSTHFIILSGGGGAWNAIRYRILHPLRNQLSDIRPPKKSNIIYLTQKNQISDITPPTK